MSATPASSANDDMAVVDSDLRVHGIERLRVIGASIFTTITNSNIHEPTTMVTEKAVELSLRSST